ncbi:hypothetical protein GCM10009716_40600 [Streptomyces sodiiphilus]|uniref:AB hydrolase-1 domain-containing protein n=1 Tax=Streptomyces sodiiphilus TaxID=226217 RepID=A0ABN2PTP2_9ACTN
MAKAADGPGRERVVRSGEPGEGVDLCVTEYGDRSRPTVLLLHGYPDSKEVWNEVAAALAGRFHVVCCDTRGCGRSTPPPVLRGGFTLDRLTGDFLAVADAVSPDAPVHVVGHDWGSVQGWELATSDRTRGRIASFTSMSGPSLDHFGLWIRERLARPRPRGLAQVLGQGVRSWYIGVLRTPRLPELAWHGPLRKLWPALLRRMEKLPADGYPTASLPRDAAHGAWLYRDNMPRLRRPRTDAFAHVPVQLIVPTGDFFLSEGLYEDIGRWVPHLEYRRLPARHWMVRTHPLRTAAWIAEFVTAREAAAGR